MTDGATPGPWKHSGVNGVHTLIGSCVATTHVQEDQRRWEDAAFIAASRTMLPAAVAAIEAVLALADELADQPNDFDEDTEAEIAAGRAIRAAITAHLDPS